MAMTNQFNCLTCGAPATFGYRDKTHPDTMRWYCAAHREAQFYADARVGPHRSCNDSAWEGWREP
jgi:hypothetical protein